MSQYRVCDDKLDWLRKEFDALRLRVAEVASPAVKEEEEVDDASDASDESDDKERLAACPPPSEEHSDGEEWCDGSYARLAGLASASFNGRFGTVGDDTLGNGRVAVLLWPDEERKTFKRSNLRAYVTRGGDVCSRCNTQVDLAAYPACGCEGGDDDTNDTDSFPCAASAAAIIPGDTSVASLSGCVTAAPT